MNAEHFTQEDEHWLRHALQLAEQAALQNEVPVGAVIIQNDKLIGEGWNQPISSHDPTAHAEIIALRKAAQHIGNYRLVDTTLYVTLEPCLMCLGAMLHSRITRLVYGAADPKVGSAALLFNEQVTGLVNHKIKVSGGLLNSECSYLLKNFFKSRR